MAIAALKILALLSLLSLILVACNDAITPTAAPYTPSPPVTTVLPPASPTPQATSTPSPVATDTPSVASTPGPTPSAVASVTPEPATLRFAVIGDYGQTGEAEAAVAGLVNSWAPDLIITTGDNNYPDGQAATIDDNIGQYYAAYIHPYRGRYGPGAAENRFFPSPGNHDWHAPDLAPYRDYFTLPGNERYYDFVRGSVHFFALDSDSREPDGVNRGSIQAQWLRDALAASESPWKIVYMHRAAYSSARHGPTDWMQWPYAEWGASAVLAGHDHVYERLQIDGIPFFTNGLGGHPGRYIFLLPRRGSQLRYNDNHGAMLVQATETDITFQFVNVQHELIDEHRIEAN